MLGTIQYFVTRKVLVYHSTTITILSDENVIIVQRNKTTCLSLLKTLTSFINFIF